MGGSQKLFEERQKRIKVKRLAAKMKVWKMISLRNGPFEDIFDLRLGYDLSSSTSVELKEAQLEMAGIDKEAQAYWKMVVPPGFSML